MLANVLPRAGMLANNSVQTTAHGHAKLTVVPDVLMPVMLNVQDVVVNVKVVASERVV